MEHAQSFNRPFPWRLAILVASAAALVALAGLVLTHRPAQTRPVSDTGRVPKRQQAVPLRPRSRISVLVLNGNGVSGAAGRLATGLLASGYRHAIPTDAPSLAYARSFVLYRPGWQGEAERLARDARIPAVAPLDGRVAPAFAHVPLVLILGR
ncbi:MAG TPA: LytR C-terminal domain-containing protein [Gaiellaceae bacterium]|nr:LytR C-terminal domain-containing protein [Gaiellaceae bacterium]